MKVLATSTRIYLMAAIFRLTMLRATKQFDRRMPYSKVRPVRKLNVSQRMLWWNLESMDGAAGINR